MDTPALNRLPARATSAGPEPRCEVEDLTETGEPLRIHHSQARAAPLSSLHKNGEPIAANLPTWQCRQPALPPNCLTLPIPPWTVPASPGATAGYIPLQPRLALPGDRAA